MAPAVANAQNGGGIPGLIFEEDIEMSSDVGRDGEGKFGISEQVATLLNPGRKSTPPGAGGGVMDEQHKNGQLSCWTEIQGL